MSDFLPKQKKIIPVELIDDAFDNVATGVEVWYVNQGKSVAHGIIVPLPVGKDGTRVAEYMHGKLRRTSVGKEAYASISEILAARGYNPADYLLLSKTYWGDYYCFVDHEEDITKTVAAEFVLARVDEAKKMVRPVPGNE